MFYIHSLDVGGAETIVTNQIIKLKENGVTSFLVVHQLKETFLLETLRNAKIKIYNIEKKIPKSPFKLLFWKLYIRLHNYSKDFNKIINREKPDLIHINTILYKFRNISFPANKIIYTFHSEVNRAISLYGKKNLNALKKYASKGMWFFALTRDMANSISRIFKTNRVEIIPNFVDFYSVVHNRFYKKDFLPTLGIPPDSFVVGHVGRFHPIKNHEKIVEVFKCVYDSNKKAFCIFIGGDVDNRIKKIRNKTIELGIDKNVLFLGSRKDATRIMGCFDALILPSYSESFSLVLIEAQVLGLKCVCSNHIPDDVICNSNCIKLSLNDSNEKWYQALTDKSVFTGENSKLRQFDSRIVIKRIIGKYNEILGEKYDSNKKK